MFLTTIQTMTEGEDLLNLQLENFPVHVSLIEVMLFKMEDNGEIAAQNYSQSCRINTLSKQVL